jgi:hypothetical protein
MFEEQRVTRFQFEIANLGVDRIDFTLRNT